MKFYCNKCEWENDNKSCPYHEPEVKSADLKKSLKTLNKTCPKCGNYVKKEGESAVISMEGTPEETRRHSEGYCPKKKS